MKNKYHTKTCVFDLPSRTILPKRVRLKNYNVGFLSLGSFSGSVYVQFFDFIDGGFVLRLLCKSGMWEEFGSLVGSSVDFRMLDTEMSSYTLRSVSLFDLCHIELVLDKG